MPPLRDTLWNRCLQASKLALKWKAVCTNAYISQTTEARVTKFRFRIRSSIWNMFLEFDHAHFHPHKSIKKMWNTRCFEASRFIFEVYADNALPQISCESANQLKLHVGRAGQLSVVHSPRCRPWPQCVFVIAFSIGASRERCWPSLLI